MARSLKKYQIAIFAKKRQVSQKAMLNSKVSCLRTFFSYPTKPALPNMNGRKLNINKIIVFKVEKN